MFCRRSSPQGPLEYSQSEITAKNTIDMCDVHAVPQLDRSKKKMYTHTREYNTYTLNNSWAMS